MYSSIYSFLKNFLGTNLTSIHRNYFLLNWNGHIHCSMGIWLYEVEKNLFQACSNTISISIVFFETLYNKPGTIIKSICKIMETTYQLRILIISTHSFCFDNIGWARKKYPSYFHFFFSFLIYSLLSPFFHSLPVVSSHHNLCPIKSVVFYLSFFLFDHSSYSNAWICRRCLYLPALVVLVRSPKGVRALLFFLE